MTRPISRLRTRLFNLSSALQSWWYRSIWGMDIGHGCKISRKARLDRTHPGGIHIGDWTAITFDVAILSHDMATNRHVDTFIGSHCFIGARSTILPGVRIGDHCVVGTGSVVMTDVPAHSIVSGNPARVVRSGVKTGRWGILDPRFHAKEAERGLRVPEPVRPEAGVVQAGAALPRLPLADLVALFQAERPGFCEADLDRPLETLGIDSFGLINLRVALEAKTGRRIDDAAWMLLSRPADLLGTRAPEPRPVEQGDMQTGTRPAAEPASDKVADVPLERIDRTLPPGPRAEPAGERRFYRINLPHMAMRGLGEPWLMKEMGDIHWSSMMRELQTSSSALADSAGNRLYATFTRIRWESDVPLTDYRESEAFELAIALQRLGAGMFFGDVTGRGAVGTIRAEIMTTFARYGEAGANTSLLKGQPVVPDGCAIPDVGRAPAFAQTYRERRAADPGPALFECDYEQQPPHDINGVGLLYFAAYPTIVELCMRRHVGARFLSAMSLVERDICYFANADPDEVLRFRLHALEEDAEGLRYTATLARSSDGRTMALASARKLHVELPPPGTPMAPRN